MQRPAWTDCPAEHFCSIVGAAEHRCQNIQAAQTCSASEVSTVAHATTHASFCPSGHPRPNWQADTGFRQRQCCDWRPIQTQSECSIIMPWLATVPRRHNSSSACRLQPGCTDCAILCKGLQESTHCKAQGSQSSTAAALQRLQPTGAGPQLKSSNHAMSSVANWVCCHVPAGTQQLPAHANGKAKAQSKNV